MFIQAHKLKRDYKITYTLFYENKDYCLSNKKYTMIIKDCFTYDEAYDRIWGKKKNQSYKEKPYKDGFNYDSDADSINDVRYDINIPIDHYEE
jgi:hypothetical protein